MSNQFGPGNNKASKLTGEQVIEIRERYATERGLSQPMLARQYDVSRNTIANVLNGSTWRHLLRGQEAQVYRPPINARAPEITDAIVEESKRRLLAREACPPKQPPGLLYTSPPPAEAEDAETGRLRMARLEQELDGPGPIRQQDIGNELGKLEKGD
jgi:hypothetical protein